MHDIVLRRVGVVGDVHTEADALDVALAALRAAQVDAILSVGDLVDGPEGDAGADRCILLLKEAHAIAVRGNHDRWALWGTMRNLTDATQMDQLALPSPLYLASLPETVLLRTAAGPLLLCHGLGRNDMASLSWSPAQAVETHEAIQTLQRQPRPRFVVHGHSHVAHVEQVEGLTFINAGTLHRGQRPCHVVLDFIDMNAVFHFHDPNRSPVTVHLDNRWKDAG